MPDVPALGGTLHRLMQQWRRLGGVGRRLHQTKSPRRSEGLIWRRLGRVNGPRRAGNYKETPISESNDYHCMRSKAIYFGQSLGRQPACIAVMMRAMCFGIGRGFVARS